MCGICGVLSFGSGTTLLAEAVSKMTRVMRNRGPDDEGYVFWTVNGNERVAFGDDTPATSRDVCAREHRICDIRDLKEPFVVGLGHRRLSILDLSPGGHQPMATDNGRYWVVYNGELYNYSDLREELSALGVSFASGSDTEVVLKAYECWGSDCLPRFNGMFAFAIWDCIDRKLFCARDPIGIKPFYYYMGSDVFVFASDVKTIIASGLYQAAPDWEGVYHSMSFGCAPRPMTCFKGVKALKQAHSMEVGMNGRLSESRYWSVPLGHAHRNGNENEWLEILSSTASESVRRQLVSDVPIGTFMSGGIDSTTLSTIAAELHPGITAFTLAFEHSGHEMDELEPATLTAKLWPMKHFVARVCADSVLEYVDEIADCYEGPFYSLSATYALSRFVAENGITVILNGLGPDELMNGYRRDLWRRRWETLRKYRWVVRHMPDTPRRLARAKVSASLHDYLDLYVHGFSYFKESEKKQLFRAPELKQYDSFETFRNLYWVDELEDADYLDAMCYFDLVNYIGNIHVHCLDQFTMKFSLEGRVPYLDREFVEMAFRLPSNLKLRNNQGKYLLRRYAANRIAPACLKMKKKGFGLPMSYWMNDGLKLVVRENLDSAKKSGLFDNALINRWYDEWACGRGPYYKIWWLVSLSRWLHSFGFSW